MNGIFGYDSKFGSFLVKCINYIFLYVLWFVFTVPIVTAGASMCAFYYTYNKAVVHDNGYIWKSFWESFKMNFKQSFGLWIIKSVIWIVLALNCYLAYVICNSEISKIAMWILVAISIVVFLWTMYWIPYVARFEDKTKTVMVNCGIIMIQNIAWSILILILTAVIVFLFFALFPIGIFGLTAIYMAVMGRIYFRILRKYMTQEAIAEEDNEIREEETNKDPVICDVKEE